jgi:hypothetical protein
MSERQPLPALVVTAENADVLRDEVMRRRVRVNGLEQELSTARRELADAEEMLARVEAGETLRFTLRRRTPSSRAAAKPVRTPQQEALLPEEDVAPATPDRSDA